MNIPTIPEHVTNTPLERHWIGLAVVGDQLSRHYAASADERALDAVRFIRAALDELEREGS